MLHYGYIGGIIYGLYFEKSIVIFFAIILVLCNLVSIFFTRNITRYLKVFAKKSIIIAIIIFALISNTYISLLDKQYEECYKKIGGESTVHGVIVDNGIEKEYYCAYILKIRDKNYKNKKVILYLDKGKKLEYGDYVSLKGEYIEPDEERNYKGFNYKEFLKTKQIIGSIKVDGSSISVLKKDKAIFISLWCNKIRQKIITNSNKILNKKSAGLLQGLLIGEKSQIDEVIKENFRASSLSHVLATSGMHINYIILGLIYLFQKSKLSKKVSYTAIIIILIIFMIITNFSPSVIRAVIMASFILIAKIIYRKPNVINSISISILIILIYNPFLLNNIGLQLSYFGTIGIVCFSKNINIKLAEISKKYFQGKVKKGIIDALSLSIAAQILIIPIIVLNFNIISLSFIISTFIAIPLVEIAVIYGFANIFISFFSMRIAKIFSIILNLIIEILIFISEIISKITILNIIVISPSIIIIAIYYSYICFEQYIFTLKKVRVHQLKKIEKVILKNKKVKKYIIIIVTIYIFSNSIYKVIPKSLQLYFIDVGQGDSTLIVTRYNKKILIDGGDNKNNILVKYLLDRKINKIDYILISHFDSDHCNGLLEVLEKIKVKNIIFSKQNQQTQEYNNIIGIIKKKRINAIIVKQDERIYIDKNAYLKVFNPNENNLESDLNNSSVVAKFVNEDFSILFTGDIGEKVEQNLVKKYKGELKSTVIKVPHHGSGTASSKEFLNVVIPKIALIGVGKNNLFGHPNSEVLKRLEQQNIKIYRTDINGEIVIKVNKKIKIKTMY